KCRRATGTITQASRSIAANNRPPTTHSLLPPETSDQTLAGAASTAAFSGRLFWADACWLFCSLETDEVFGVSAPTAFGAVADWSPTAGDWDTGCWDTDCWDTDCWDTGCWDTGCWDTGCWDTGCWDTGCWDTGCSGCGLISAAGSLDGCLAV